jgi:glycosyltransferase involved in cell wall biosynthesis
MKIAQITPYFLPHTGGVERYVYNLSKNLINEGHTVEVITSNVPEGRTVDVVDGIPVRRLKCIGEPLRNPLVPSIFLLLDELKKFDIIHVHNLYSSLALSIPLLKKFCKIPLVLTHHGQLIYGEPMKDTCVKIYEKSIEKIILKSVDNAVVLSESDAQYISLSGLKMDRVKILPNAINPADFTAYTNVDTTEFIEKYHLGGRKRILFVGEVTNRKGIPTLIKSIPPLIKKVLTEEVVFVIVGSGENLSDARALAKDLDVESHVVFTGRLPFVELMQAYCSSDLFVLPSLSEGLPTSILEAMYFGLPVVSTDIPGVRDHFSDFALLVPPSDEHALADAIHALLDDEDLAKSISRRGKALVVSRYTWDQVTREYETLYSNVCEFDSGRS